MDDQEISNDDDDQKLFDNNGKLEIRKHRGKSAKSSNRGKENKTSRNTGSEDKCVNETKASAKKSKYTKRAYSERLKILYIFFCENFWIFLAGEVQQQSPSKCGGKKMRKNVESKNY